MHLEAKRTIYFLGIGGIGMSALARYFAAEGHCVMGYDSTPSPLTHALEAEGIAIQYDDTTAWVEQLHKEQTLVVRTPAVPAQTAIYCYLQEQGFNIYKRAEVLGWVTRQKKTLCVAGTHGKTTTSTILAHILHHSHMGANAFLGGIANNYATNVLLDSQSEYVVVEADEFDRSFHHLAPYISIITSMDPDHLDIYGTEEAYRASFAYYASLVRNTLVIKHSIAEHIVYNGEKVEATVYTYAVGEKADFYADNIRILDGQIYFDFHTPENVIADMQLGVPVWVNIENSVAAMAVAWLVGATEEALRQGTSTFAGVYRRFNIQVNTPQVIYIDDYAHHPQELASTIQSVRLLYPDRYVIGVFQPHLYSRTRDFVDDFAQVLSQLDEVALLPIYPAREEAIEGVTSEWLMQKIGERGEMPGKKGMIKRALVLPAILPKYLRERLKSCLKADKKVVIITMGAGDIDRQVNEITHQLTYKIL